jgi:hypothetical protein
MHFHLKTPNYGQHCEEDIDSGFFLFEIDIEYGGRIRPPRVLPNPIQTVS